MPIQSIIERMRAQSAIGDAHRKKVKHEFESAVQDMDAETRCLPEDTEDLEEEQRDWVVRFAAVMVSHDGLAGDF